MDNFIVLFDACVLYPAPLRDLLMRLSLTDLFRAKWTNEIHDEWIRNLLAKRSDLTMEKLERTRKLMNSNALDCLVDNYEAIISTVSLPDKNDRHVLAAAIKSGADTIVTMNLKDFPSEVLKPYEIEAQHPDDFIRNLIDFELATVLSAIKKCRKSLKNPPKTTKEYLTILEKQSLPATVLLLREYEELI